MPFDEALREQIAALCQAHAVAELAVFGSLARGDERADSDADVLVRFTGTHDLFDRFMGLKESLEQVFGRPVDLVMADAILNPVFRESVMRERVPLYAA